MAHTNSIQRGSSLTVKFVLAMTVALSLTINPSINFMTQTEGPGRAHTLQ
jgi:hypothetical protein